MEDEDLIPVEDVIIMLTESGYIKRQSVDTYKAQNRGGRGIKSLTLNEEDSIDTMISMSTHDYLLLFTNTGRVYRMRGFNVPNASRTSKGIPIVNLLTLEKVNKSKLYNLYQKIISLMVSNLRTYYLLLKWYCKTYFC